MFLDHVEQMAPTVDQPNKTPLWTYFKSRIMRGAPDIADFDVLDLPELAIPTWPDEKEGPILWRLIFKTCVRYSMGSDETTAPDGSRIWT